MSRYALVCTVLLSLSFSMPVFAPPAATLPAAALPASEPALAVPATMPTFMPALEVPEDPCRGRPGSSRWIGRSDDDEWIPGLYPARERYGEGLLALTFDDGPHEHTPLVLAELARRDMRATFFLTGHAIRSSNYHVVRQMVADGHTLANHGWRHDTRMAALVSNQPVEREASPHAGRSPSTGGFHGRAHGPRELEAYVEAEFELTQIRVDLALMAESPEDFRAIDREVFGRLSWIEHDRQQQLARMPDIRERHRALLESRGYGEDHRPLRLAWVRPPGGNPYVGGRWTTVEREAFARAVNRLGLRMVMWSGGSGDSDPKLPHGERMNPERIAETARAAARRGGIYVAHDRIAPAALRAMLDQLAASEVRIVELEQLWRLELGCPAS